MLSESDSLSPELADAECRLWVLNGFLEIQSGVLRTQNPLDTNLPHENRKAKTEVRAKGDQPVTPLNTPLPQAPPGSQCLAVWGGAGRELGTGS